MHSISTRHRIAIAAALVLLMAATRYHHFGDTLRLPDASLAVFFAAGFYLPRRWPLALLMGEAALVDYLAITVGGVSAWCVSPAYVFLIPTYGAMWLGGRWYARRHALAWPSAIPLVVALTLSGSLAFLISNGSFYLLSGRFPELSWAQYAERVARYFWPYLSTVFVYAGAIGFVHLLLATVAQARGAKAESGR